MLILVVCGASFSAAEPLGIYKHGRVVRMRMGECPALQHGFMVTFGPPAGQFPAEGCPEYTLVSDKVVFVIVGRSSSQLVPLADVIDFRLHNNELLVRLDDAHHETKFSIKEMILRSEWDLIQKHVNEQLNAPVEPTESVMRAQE